MFGALAERLFFPWL